MKKHGVIINMTIDFLVFWLGHYIYIEAISPTILSQPRLPTEIAAVKVEKVVTPRKIIKKSSKEDIINFLQMPNKLSSKKRKKIHQSKRKVNSRETSSKKAIFSSLDSLEKKELPVPILVTIKSNPKAKDINIAKISADAYCVACHLKKTQVFTISMRDI